MYLANKFAGRLIDGWIVCLRLLCAAAFGQANTATVTRTVTDPSAGAVPHARIQAKNQATGATTSSITNTTGRFKLLCPICRSERTR